MATDQSQQSRPASKLLFAKAQLSLVEHALCPLDPEASLQPGLCFATSYAFSDGHRNRRTAHVQIGAVDGMSAHDEIYLWGLLSLALAQADPRPELLATPYYCLRQLGLISTDKRGGREFQLFRAAVKRLAGVRYKNDSFYDPIRGENRQVAFGFLNYSLPLDDDSSRAWRFAWDPIFFELAHAARGTLSFNLKLYRDLDPASRRLYLYLKKVFWRSESTGLLELRHLAVDVLGFSATLRTGDLRKKLCACIEHLRSRELLRLPVGAPSVTSLFQKERKGVYKLRLHRGPAFSNTSAFQDSVESPLIDPLRSIGFDDASIQRILRRYPARVLEQWADITLAARERRGEKFFTNSPQAYFLDNVKAAVGSGRTPPDWWWDLRREELRRESEQRRAKEQVLDTDEAGFEEYLRTEAEEAFRKVTDQLAHDLKKAGQSEHEARTNAGYMAKVHFRSRYREKCGQRGYSD